MRGAWHWRFALAHEAAAAGLALALFAPACQADDEGLARSRTLVIGKPSDVVTMDPGATINANDFGPIDLAYERLLRYAVRDGVPTGELVGELATAWRAVEGGRAWEFTLATGHCFDDGTPVTAEAVRFSFERLHTLGLGPAQALSGFQRVEVRDARTVRFHLAAPSPIFPMILALPPMAIINPRVMRHEEQQDQARGWLSRHSAGSGPYQLSSWQRGMRITMKANPCRRPAPRHFDRVVFKVLRDDAARRLQLARGDIDVFEGANAGSAAYLARLPGVTLVSRPSPVLIALALNNQRAPLNDVRVRRALALAVDADALTRSVVKGFAATLHGVLPEGVAGHDAGIAAPQRDLAAARALLAEAGVARPLRLRLSYMPTSPLTEAVVLALQSQLAEAGVAVAPEVLAPAAFAKVRSGDFDIAFGSWYADFPDPWTIMPFTYHSAAIGQGVNLARYARPEVDRLLDAADTALDPRARLALYAQAQRLIVADQPMINLFALHGLLALRSDLLGLDYNFSQPGTYNAAAMSRAGAAP
jgi:peptide/nickel transport system substrate-binding protein